MNSNLRTGDTVIVIAGKDKGKSGKIVSSNSETRRVVVEGINIVHKHSKPRSQKDKGGIKKKEAAIDVSNVMLVCSSCNKPTRIAHSFDEKGNKHRICKHCGAVIDGKFVKPKAKKETVKKEKEKVEKAETKETKAVAPKKTAPKTAAKPVDTANKVAGTTRRKAPVAKSQGK